MRRHFLDNIRWMTVLLVLVYHVCYLYNTVGVPFPIAPDAGLRVMDNLAAILYPWFMVLLYLIAGISARYALQVQPPREFARCKRDRLLVPSTLGLLCWQFLCGIINVQAGGGLETIPVFLRYPIFVLSGTGPLWFIQLLFVYSMLLLLLRRLPAFEALGRAGEHTPLPVLLILGMLIWGAAQVLNMPVITTYRIGIYGTAYLLGYLVFAHESVQLRLVRARWGLLAGAAALGIGYMVVFQGQNFVADACLKHPLTNAYLWLAVLAILGCGRAWANHTSPLAAYFTQRSFGIYVLHYLVTLVVCMLLVRVGLPPLARYLIAWGMILPLTLLLTELFLRIPGWRYVVLGVRGVQKENAKQS